MDADPREPPAISRAALSTDDAIERAVETSCTTAVVHALSTQLIEEIQCLRPGTFASLEGAAGIELGPAAFPWLQAPAREALVRAQKERGVTMQINSGLRTLPQQYILYRWYKTDRCGIGLAAMPGRSNHESGLAVDIADNAGWQAPMRAAGFEWFGTNDPVHFDFSGDGKVDLGGTSVLAFQRLWNRNHPEDRIDEDSSYGTETEERIARSPVGGFTKGAECTAPPSPPEESLPPVADDGCAIRSRPAGRSVHPALATIALVLAHRRRRTR